MGDHPGVRPVSLRFRPKSAFVVLLNSVPQRTRLSYLAVVVETRRNRPRIVLNLCVSVCGYRAGYLGLGLAKLAAQIRPEIEDPRPDP